MCVRACVCTCLNISVDRYKYLPSELVPGVVVVVDVVVDGVVDETN